MKPKSDYSSEIQFDPDFMKNHLKLLSPSIFASGCKQDHEFVDAICDSTAWSRRIETALPSLLNNYSERAFEHVPKSERPPHQYIFLGCDTFTLSHPTFDDMDKQDKKDVVMISGPRVDIEVNASGRLKKHKISFRDVVSVVKCSLTAASGHDRVAKWSRHLLISRPDLFGTYVLSANTRSYQILWSDASGEIASPLYKWTELAPLAAYVSSLYIPPQHHVLFDPSVTRELDPLTNKQTWSIKNLHGGAHTGCTLVFSGDDPWRRRMHAWKCLNEQGRTVVIKNVFNAIDKGWNESAFLRCVHWHGVYPGVVRKLSSDNPAPLPSVWTA
ncbi:hypothetical protein NLI96_g779 [Meripilus lineatus]|uniref:Fungal-type protein kinase domain-containing protein n=1 Tax=Meripilus lineatus TaxID=2056292 RepID=A0AAD5VDQ2_9APHY|nr:hypothetical protein NLI96_g779 [Physisporinus lineatus]